MKKNIIKNLVKKAIKEINLNEAQICNCNHHAYGNPNYSFYCSEGCCGSSHTHNGITYTHDAAGDEDCPSVVPVDDDPTFAGADKKKNSGTSNDAGDPRPQKPKRDRKPTTAIDEAEITADNTKFSIKVDVSNKQSETKLGIRIQLTPKGGMLEPDVRDKLEAAIMKKLNNALEKFDIQVSKDTDVPNPEVLGFFIPLSHIKNMIITSIKGPDTASMPPPPTTTPPPVKPPSSMETEPIDEMVDRMIDEELITEMRQRTLNEISQIVIREDFYGFVNAGNNMLRSLEETGYDMREAKNYLKYLVKHNIM